MGPYDFNQTIDQFLNAEHSRASLSIEGLGENKRNEFDCKMKEILQPFIENGILKYQVKTRVVWGKAIHCEQDNQMNSSTA